MRYAQSGIRGYAPPGGVCGGHRYEDRPDQGDPHMSVNCPRCEPWLAKDPLWAGSAVQVPLTAAEEQEAEAAKKATDSLDARQILSLVAALTAGQLGNPLAAIGGQAPAGAPAPPAPAAPAVTAPAAGAQSPAPKGSRSRKTTAGAAV